MTNPAIETIFTEERRYPPTEDFAAQANAQPDIYERGFEEFWETLADPAVVAEIRDRAVTEPSEE